MSNLEKIAITSNEKGYVVKARNSPTLDDKFYKSLNLKDEKDKESKKDVEIKYIKLDGLLIEKGAEMMDLLSDKKYIDIMAIPFIQYVVMFQWQET